MTLRVIFIARPIFARNHHSAFPNKGAEKGIKLGQIRQKIRQALHPTPMGGAVTGRSPWDAIRSRVDRIFSGSCSIKFLIRAIRAKLARPRPLRRLGPVFVSALRLLLERLTRHVEEDHVRQTLMFVCR